ncbi:MAG: glycosyltransferase family 9 protein [bacterium]|nr:glycosyltransferase family 9 protein [bacterium]
MPDSSPSVLVIRLDAIGDALALTPLLAAFAERAIPVDLVLRAMNAHVFASRAARETFVAPFALRSSTRENRAAIASFGRALRGRAYSHVLVATEDPGGYRLARAVGAPERIGFTNGWGKPFKTLWARTILTRSVVRSAGLDPNAPHECEVLFSLARPLLGDAEPTRDPARLRPFVIEREVPRGERVVFQVSDKWERLGIAFGEVVQAIAACADVAPLALIASTNESLYAERVARASGLTVTCFDELEPWKEAIAGARALVAPDSGALHVAGMLGTPTVAVFPPIASFVLQTARWRPWAAPCEVVRAEGAWPLHAATALAAVVR